MCACVLACVLSRDRSARAVRKLRGKKKHGKSGVRSYSVKRVCLFVCLKTKQNKTPEQEEKLRVFLRSETLALLSQCAAVITNANSPPNTTRTLTTAAIMRSLTRHAMRCDAIRSCALFFFFFALRLHTPAACILLQLPLICRTRLLERGPRETGMRERARADLHYCYFFEYCDPV